MVNLKQGVTQNTGLVVSRLTDDTVYAIAAATTEQVTYELKLASPNNIILGYRWKCSLTGGAGTDSGNYPLAWIRIKQTDSDTSTTSINIDSNQVKRNTPGIENSEWINVVFGTDYFSQKVSSQILLPPYLMGQTSYYLVLITDTIGNFIANTSVTNIELEVFYMDNGIMKTSNLFIT